MQALRSYFLFILLAGMILFALYPRYYPLMGLNQNVGSDKIIRTAQEMAFLFSMDVSEYHPIVKLEQNVNLIKYVQKTVGLQKANALLRKQVNGYYYDVRWVPTNIFSVNNNNNGDENNVNKIIKSIQLKFDTRGNLIGLDRTIADTGRVRSVSKKEAAQIANRFLEHYSSIRLFADTSRLDSSLEISARAVDEGGSAGDSKAPGKNRVDYEFVRHIPIEAMPDTMKIRLAMVGDQIVKLTQELDIPEAEPQAPHFIAKMLMILVYLGFFIALSILWFKRVRSYEIGFKLAIKLGILSAAATFFGILLSLSYPFYWGNIFEIILGPIFIGLGIFVLWMTSESLIREVWNEKLLTVDLLLNGYILDSHIGTSLIRGISLGLSTLAVLLVGAAAADYFFDISLLYLTDSNIVFATAAEPGLYLAFRNVSYALAASLFSFLVIPGLLRKWVNIPVFFISITVVVFSLVFYDVFSPQWTGLLIMAVVGLVFTLSVFRFDFLTVAVAFYVFQLSKGGLFLVFGQDGFGWTYIIGFAITLAYAVAAVLTRDSLDDYTRITPRYVKFINERQRLQRELEIAREVQMSFLPDQMPRIPGLDIAARCVPALEVGGDYYDFVRLNRSKLGVAIGDVAGKGTQAACYMTLTKGFLRAVSRQQDSPKRILSEMNALFFENARRNTFISMVYAVFDVEKGKATIARAGHNPILRIPSVNSQPQILQPDGLALGLEKGPIFDEIIEEITLTLHKDDIFVFYTDGLNEAMDSSEKEFGEERLQRLLAEYKELPVQEILDRVYAEVDKFAGKKGQRDDMTMIIIRVTEV